MNMVNMQLAPDEVKNDSICCSPDADEGGPKYPYGLMIWLDEESLKKLGIDTLPAVGATMALNATVRVTGVSQRETQKEMCQTVDMQITDMELKPQAATPAAGLYPSMVKA